MIDINLNHLKNFMSAVHKYIKLYNDIPQHHKIKYSNKKTVYYLFMLNKQ